MDSEEANGLKMGSYTLGFCRERLPPDNTKRFALGRRASEGKILRFGFFSCLWMFIPSWSETWLGGPGWAGLARTVC